MVLLVGWFSWVRLVAMGVWWLPAAGRRLRGRLVRGSSRGAGGAPPCVLCVSCLPPCRLGRPRVSGVGRGCWAPMGFRGGALWLLSVCCGGLVGGSLCGFVSGAFRSSCPALHFFLLCCVVWFRGPVGPFSCAVLFRGFSCHACSLTASCHRVTHLTVMAGHVLTNSTLISPRAPWSQVIIGYMETSLSIFICQTQTQACCITNKRTRAC